MNSTYRIDILEDFLRTLTNSVDAIRGAVLVSAEGFVVAAYGRPGPAGGAEDGQSPQVAAMSAALLALGDQTLRRLAQGNLARLLIEGQSGATIVYPVQAGIALAVLVTKEAKMGLVMYAVARTAKQLSGVLTRS